VKEIKCHLNILEAASVEISGMALRGRLNGK
jgi:hypothetical protein